MGTAAKKKNHSKHGSGMMKKRFGFSAVELLITIGLMTTAAGVMVPMFREYQINADLNTATEHIVQALRSAQTLSQSGKFDAVWGVYFPEATLFAGDAYAQRNTDHDTTFPMASTIETSGLTETLFTRIEGLPTIVGSVYVVSSITGDYRRIDIDKNGIITVSGLMEFIPGQNPDGTSSGDGSGDTGDGSSGSSASDGSASSGTGGSSDSSTGASSSSDGAGTSSSSSDGGSDGGSGTSSSSDQGGGGGEIPCDVRFSLKDGNDIETVGTNDINVRVLGSAITYGAGGPKIDVRLSASFDGTEWTDLFGGKAVSGNEQVTFQNLPTETPFLLRFNGRYSWLFNKTFKSNARDGHVIMLKNGDKAPAYAPFDHQESLESFLKGVLDAKGRIAIGPRDLLLLVEMGSLDRASDFQDAVVLITFSAKPTTCVDGAKERIKIHFNRLENTGSGNASPRVYVGPNALSFAADQWIPLVDSLGNRIIDAGLVEDVKGLALERGDGWVRIVSRGSHPNSSGKEIVDATSLFNHAIITSIENDPENPSENPRDGTENDTSAGDEFVDGPNVKSMIFKTRVTTEDDGVILHWIKGQPSDAGAASSASSQTSSSSSSVSSASEETAFIPDSCSVPYDIDSAGRIKLKGKADVSVRLVGSESTYGKRGPKIAMRSTVSFDDGSSWKQLFGNRSVRGGELSVFSDTVSGSTILLSFNGRYSWTFNKTVQSGRGDKHVRVLRPGQTIDGLSAILARGEMRGFLRNILDARAKTKIGNHDIAFLVELGDTKDADYHDAVAIVSIDRPRSMGVCGTSSSSSSEDNANLPSSTSSVASLEGSGDSDGDGITNADDLCPAGTTIPESVPTEQLTFDRYALTASRGNRNSIPVFRTGPRKKVSNYSLQDSRGCSCSQILNAIEEKGQPHRFSEYPVLYRQMKNLFSFYISDARKFGCSASLIRMIADDREKD